MELTEQQHDELLAQRVMVKEVGKDEYEATVIKSSAMGTLVKPKGTSQAKLVLASEIEDITIVPTKPSELKQQRLDPLVAKNARRHLLNYHGISLAQVNEITDETAVELHATLPHTDTGHNHDGRKKADEANESE